jgi:hypothetical protein
MRAGLGNGLGGVSELSSQIADNLQLGLNPPIGSERFGSLAANLDAQTVLGTSGLGGFSGTTVGSVGSVDSVSSGLGPSGLGNFGAGASLAGTVSGSSQMQVGVMDTSSRHCPWTIQHFWKHRAFFESLSAFEQYRSQTVL